MFKNQFNERFSVCATEINPVVSSTALVHRAFNSEIVQSSLQTDDIIKRERVGAEFYVPALLPSAPVVHVPDSESARTQEAKDRSGDSFWARAPTSRPFAVEEFPQVTKKSASSAFGVQRSSPGRGRFSFCDWMIGTEECGHLSHFPQKIVGVASLVRKSKATTSGIRWLSDTPISENSSKNRFKLCTLNPFFFSEDQNLSLSDLGRVADSTGIPPAGFAFEGTETVPLIRRVSFDYLAAVGAFPAWVKSASDNSVMFLAHESHTTTTRRYSQTWESSEAIRWAPEQPGKDMVRSAWRHAEVDQPCRSTRLSSHFGDKRNTGNPAGIRDELRYQMTKALKQWKRDVEHEIINGNTASAASIRCARGITRWLRGGTNFGGKTADVTGSNTALNLQEDDLNAMLQRIWVSGGLADYIICSPTQKRHISSNFAGSANSRRTNPLTDNMLVNVVDFYDSDFGNVKILPHRWFTTATSVPGQDVQRTTFAIQSDKWVMGFLRPPRNIPLAKIGSSERAMVEGEWTLISLHPSANGFISLHASGSTFADNFPSN